MYLVELRPGREELYRSSDELALAIRNGDVDARSRIYHRATAKWISITLHPQYKAIVTAAKEEPTARPARKGWTFLGGISPSPEPVSEPAVAKGNLLHSWRRPLALGISGVLLMLGVQLAFSGPRPPWAGHRSVVAVKAPARAPVERLAADDRQEMVSLASTTTVWPNEAQRTPVVDPVPAPATTVEVVEPAAKGPAIKVKTAALLPRAPVLRPKSLNADLQPSATRKLEASSVEAILDRYTAAHEAARARLESGIRVARLSGLFAASRLSPDGGVTDTRMSLAGAVNFIRVFRQQQAAIEAAYQDTVTVFARRFGWSPTEVRQWYSRPAQTEESALEGLTGSLLTNIDSVLGVLSAQAGAYKIRGNAIAFEYPAAAKTYGALRRRIKQQLDSAVAAGGVNSSGPTALLLQAIGTTSLPRET